MNVTEVKDAKEKSPEVVPDHPLDAPGRRRAPGRAFFVWAVPALATFVVLCIRNSYLFSVNIREDGDSAVNSILVQKALHGRLLVGNYSRVGFHHPGPAFLYVMAAGEALFYRLLGVAASPFNGQLLGVFALNALLIGLVVSIFYRHTRSIPVTAVVFGVIALFVAHHETIDSAWFPHLYFMSFLLVMVAGASIATGDLAELPAFVLAGGLLVHGHVSFIEFVGGWTVVVAIAWMARHRRQVRADLARHARALKLAGGLLALFLLPMVLNVVLHFPGEWGKYALYIRHNGVNTHPLGRALHYLLGFWAHRPRSGALLAGAGLLGAGLVALEPDNERRRFFGCLLGAAFVMSVLFLAYVIRGVDDLSQGYIGVFYMTVPLLVLAVSAASLTSAVVFRRRVRGVATDSRDSTDASLGITGNAAVMVAERVGQPTKTRGAVATAVMLAVAAAILVAAGIGPQLANPYRGTSDFPAAIASVRSAPARAGRVVAIEFPHDEWPVVMGFLVNGRRAGLTSCIVDPFWTFMVTSDNICSGRLATAWRIRFDPVGNPPQQGAAVWSDTLTVITASS